MLDLPGYVNGLGSDIGLLLLGKGSLYFLNSEQILPSTASKSNTEQLNTEHRTIFNIEPRWWPSVIDSENISNRENAAVYVSFTAAKNIDAGDRLLADPSKWPPPFNVGTDNKRPTNAMQTHTVTDTEHAVDLDSDFDSGAENHVYVLAETGELWSPPTQREL